MLRILKYIVLLGLFPILVLARQEDAMQPIMRRLSFHGNIHAADDILTAALGIREGDRLPVGWPEASLGNLLDWCRAQGFWQARIDSVHRTFTADSGFVVVAVWVEEGDPVRVGEVMVGGLQTFDGPNITALFETRPGKTFNESLLKKDVDAALTVLENNGHPLARIRIDSLHLRSQGRKSVLDIGLEIEEGPRILIDSIGVSGNTQTKDRVIVRESRLKEGSLYRREDILFAHERLEKLGYFQEVGEPEVAFLKDGAVVILPVKDGTASTIDGVVGYVPPPSEEENGYLTGRLTLAFRNLLGTGRLLEAHWEKKDATSQTMQFGYAEPWVLGQPLWAGLRFQQEVRDTTYIERAWSFPLTYAPWSNLAFQAEVRVREVIPDSVGSVEMGIPRSSSWLFSAGIDYNTLDDPLNPRRGVRYHTTVEVGRKRNTGPDFLMEQDDWQSTVDTRRIRLDAEAAFRPFRRQVVYLGVHGVEVKTGDAYVPVSDQVRFGGARTLRGYEEDVFRGTLVAWGNLEYRYLLGRRSRVFVFIDGGLYQRREEVGNIRGTKFGYGFGIRLETPLGLMGIDFGLGEGDGLLQGKVHVGVVGRF